MVPRGVRDEKGYDEVDRPQMMEYVELPWRGPGEPTGQLVLGRFLRERRSKRVSTVTVYVTVTPSPRLVSVLFVRRDIKETLSVWECVVTHMDL